MSGLLEKLIKINQQDKGLLQKAIYLLSLDKNKYDFSDSNEMENLVNDLSEEDFSFNKKKIYHAEFKARFIFETAKLLESLSRTEINMVNPAIIFRVLTDYFKIQKGALLILDYTKKFFIPWAFAGFDNTTKHRLRIPFDFIKESGLNFQANSIKLEKNDLEVFKNFFSTRESFELENLLVMPLSAFDNLFGLLLITKADSLTADPQTIEEELKKFRRIISELLYNSRKAFWESAGINLIKDDLSLYLQELIKSNNEKYSKIVIALFNFEKFDEYIKQNFSELDNYQVRDDILKLLQSMTAENSSFFKIDEKKYVILFYGPLARNDEILKFQIDMSIKNFFIDIENFPEIMAEHKKYPEDGSAADVLLKNIL